MKLLIVVVTLALFSGCSSVVDQTASPSLIGLLGVMTLTEDVSICKDVKGDPNRPPDIDLKIHSILGYDRCEFGDHEQKFVLKAGTLVNVEKIEERKFLNLWKYQWWILIGSVDIDGQRVRFYYKYTLTTDSPEVPTTVAFPPPWK